MNKEIQINVNVHCNSKEQECIEICNTQTDNSGTNPLDYFGKLHNEFLIATSNRNDLNNDDKIIEASKNWFKDILLKDLEKVDDLFNLNKRLDLEELFETHNPYPGLKKYLDKLCRLLKNPETIEIQDVHSGIINLEKEVMRNSSLSAKESQSMLFSLAIARNSLNHWDAQYASEQKPNDDGTSSKPRKFWKVIGVIAADVGGGFVGSLVGPLVGAATATAASKAAG